MTEATVGIIGGGNMGGALAGGLHAGGWRVAVAQRSEAGREKLRRAFAGMSVVAEAGEFSFVPDLLILAVKPKQLRACCEAIRTGGLSEKTTVASVAAGAKWQALSEWLGGFSNVVRTMPNTPSLIGMGMTVCFAPPALGAAERDLVGRALGCAGEVLWLESEAEMDAMTALSGCGPAYGYLLAEAMAAGGAEMGLNAEAVRRATAQTLRGAAEMLLRGDADPAELRRAVTSPGGATAAALEVFAGGDFRGLVAKAMRAAKKRAEEIGDELEGESKD